MGCCCVSPPPPLSSSSLTSRVLRERRGCVQADFEDDMGGRIPTSGPSVVVVPKLEQRSPCVAGIQTFLRDCAPVGGWNERRCDALQLLEALHLLDRRGADAECVDRCASLLRQCGNVKALSAGRRVHAIMIRRGQDRETFLGNLLVQMYGKCGRLENARAVFDGIRGRNLFSWNIMIAAYAQNRRGKEALRLFGQMRLEGVKPDRFSFTSVLSACASLGSLAEGKMIHACVVACGFDTDVVVGTALVNMYGKCGILKDAIVVFRKIRGRDVISWNAMIAAYAQNWHGKEALELFEQMELEGVKPDRITFLSILDACANLVALTKGRSIHARIVAIGLESDVLLDTALVDMYGKCGNVNDARSVFDKIHQRDVVSWTAMIAAYAQNGHAREALQLFRQMELERVQPNETTFLSVLHACSHAGLLDEGRQYFVSMTGDHGIAPTAEHYGCMIDLLGRAGRLDEADDLINNMPVQPHFVTWMALLAACRIHGDVERGTRAAEHVFELDPKNASPYVLLSNIYAAAGRWNDVARVRKVMDERIVKKPPGCSSIEVDDVVHEFMVGDMSHPQAKDIFAELQKLSRQMEDAGYVSDTKAVLHDVEEEEKADMLFYHSEKLAIGFGLITTPSGTPLRISKNLRICSDCHAAIKFISNIVGREIVLRDTNRFHCFKYGVCSCGDYW